MAICGIYKITNLINNKSYIGQSIDIEARMKKHRYSNDDFVIHKAIHKYDWNNFTYEILEVCTPEQLNEREIYWINYYDTQRIGYNMIPGGSNSTWTTKARAVYQYNLNGNFIKRYNSAHEADRETGINYSSICACARGEIKHTNNYYWSYNDLGEKIAPINKDKNESGIKQYSLTGELLNCYTSIKEASEKTHTHQSAIVSVCKKQKKSAGGFQWQYGNDKMPIKSIATVIEQYDLHHNLITTYNSVMEASKKTKIDDSCISNCILGRRKTAGGFIWKKSIK